MFSIFSMEPFSATVVVGDILVVLSLILLISIDKPMPPAPLAPVKVGVNKPNVKPSAKRSA